MTVSLQVKPQQNTISCISQDSFCSSSMVSASAVASSTEVLSGRNQATSSLPSPNSLAAMRLPGLFPKFTVVVTYTSGSCCRLLQCHYMLGQLVCLNSLVKIGRVLFCAYWNSCIRRVTVNKSTRAKGPFIRQSFNNFPDSGAA
jgi:hypothetical protein